MALLVVLSTTFLLSVTGFCLNLLGVIRARVGSQTKVGSVAKLQKLIVWHLERVVAGGIAPNEGLTGCLGSGEEKLKDGD